MKRLIVLLLTVACAAKAQTIGEFRQWYLDKQLINPALLVNAPASNTMLSFSPGRYTVNHPGNSYTYNNYQFLATGTYHPNKSPHHFGASIWGQQQATNNLMLNYAYEMPIDRRTNLAFGGTLGIYEPVGFQGAKVFRYGAGVALQNKNKENYVGLSFPHIVTAVHEGTFKQGNYYALILQGGYTFYLPYQLKFIPTAYLQADITKAHRPAGPSQLFAADLAFRYQDFIYVNAAVSVQNFNFKTTGLQRFGAGFKPTPELMIGYQRDALDATDFRYHSIWVRYLFPAKARASASNNRPATHTSKPLGSSTKATPKTTQSKPKPTTGQKKP